MNSDSQSVSDALPRPGSGSSSTHPQPTADQSAGAGTQTSPKAGSPATERRSRKAAFPLHFPFDSLRNGNYARLWVGMLFSMGGIQMQMIARGYFVYDLTGSAKLLGIVSAGGAVPVLVLALFGGALADRVPRKRVIQAGQATSAIIALVIGVMIATGTVTWVHLLVASMVQGSTWAFMMPARQAFIPQLVGRDNVGNAVALSAAGMSVTTLIAPAVAGVLYAVIGPEGVYFVISGMVWVAFVVTSTITQSGESEEKVSSAVMADIKEGIVYMLNDRLILALLGLSMAFVLLAMPINFLMPVLVVDIYDKESEAFGLLLSMMGLGSLAGSLVVASLGHWRRGALIIGGGFVTGIALLLMAGIPYYFAGAGIMVVLGVGNAANRAVNQGLVMEHVEDRYRGRVMSVYMMSFGLMPLGVLPMGIGADVFGPRAVIAVMAVGMLLVTTFALATQRRLRAID